MKHIVDIINRGEEIPSNSLSKIDNSWQSKTMPITQSTSLKSESKPKFHDRVINFFEKMEKLVHIYFFKIKE